MSEAIKWKVVINASGQIKKNTKRLGASVQLIHFLGPFRNYLFHQNVNNSVLSITATNSTLTVIQEKILLTLHHKR